MKLIDESKLKKEAINFAKYALENNTYYSKEESFCMGSYFSQTELIPFICAFADYCVKRSITMKRYCVGTSRELLAEFVKESGILSLPCEDNSDDDDLFGVNK